MAAVEAEHLQALRHSPVLPRQILKGSPIGAVHPRRGSSATRTGGIDRGNVSGDQEPARVQRQIIDVNTVRTDGIDGLEIGIVLPSGHNADQRLSYPPAPKVRMNPYSTPKHSPEADVRFPTHPRRLVRYGRFP